MKRSAKFSRKDSLSTIIKVCTEYFQQENSRITKEHYHLFIETLPDNLQIYFIQKGYLKTCNSSLFKRFVLEISGQSMHSFLEERLTAKEFEMWKAQDQYYRELLTSVN